MKKISKVCGTSLVESANAIDYHYQKIFIYDEITPYLNIDIVDALHHFSQTKKDINIYISSYGGELYSAISICNSLLNCENTINIEIDYAMSGAAMIALCGDNIRMSKHGILMLHYASWASPYQKQQEHEIETKVTKEVFERVMKTLLEGTKYSLKKFQQDADNKDVYFTPTKAKQLGLIDEVI